ncbi:MAG TPA: glycosyltransferase family 4 protein [Nitrospira sp.]
MVKSKLRLCFVGPAENITLRRWVRWFADKGHDATIVTVEPAETGETAGFHQIDISLPTLLRKLSRVISVVRLLKEIRKLKPDVVHVHYLRGLAWGLGLKPFHPTVVTPWGSDVLEEQGAFREWYSKRLTSAVIRMADLIAVHSDFLESKVRLLGPKPDSVVRIGWGVDLARFRPGLAVELLRRRWNIADDMPVIFSPRLAQRFYNHHLVVQALEGIRRAFPKIVLVISEQFGDPAYMRELKTLVEQLRVSQHVRFVGRIPYEDMPLWFNLSTLVVMIPESDGMPNTLFEAMACGAVPVLRDLPQYRELIREDVNGKYVSATPESVVEGVVTLLKAGERRQEMASVNLSLVREVADQSKEMHRMEQWYYKLAGAASC